MSGPSAAPGAAAALARAAAAGPYFTIQPWSPAAGWWPLGTLISDPVALSERVGQARTALAGRAGIAPVEIEERVAASIVFLGLAAQLVSPLLGATVIGETVPLLALADLWWLPVDSGPWLLATSPADGIVVGQLTSDREVREAAVLLSDRVNRLAGPVAAAFGAVFRLSQQVLRGNVASALAGASGVLAGAFPGRASTAGQLTAQVLALGPLRGTGRFVQPAAGPPRRFFVRRSCCLLYRVPGAGMCGDCVLRREGPRQL
jgi:hypothetical protein